MTFSDKQEHVLHNPPQLEGGWYSGKTLGTGTKILDIGIRDMNCLKHRASSIEHRASSIEHRASSIEHRASSLTSPPDAFPQTALPETPTSGYELHGREALVVQLLLMMAQAQARDDTYVHP